MMSKNIITHIAGTFLIEATGSFLNGAGYGEGEDRNVSVPKTFQDGRFRVPYVSAQAWKRWLRNTLIEETGWQPSVIKAIDKTAKGTTNKISGETNPIEYAEDDIFGYMKTRKGQGKKVLEDIDEEEIGDESGGKTVKSVMRASPFAASILVSIKNSGWQGRDKGFVHLQEGTPLPYTTEFYNTHLHGVFCLNYSRLGQFMNLGDRIEIDETLASKMLKDNKISVKEEKGNGKIFELTDKSLRKERASALLKSLAVLRGGAKQAQFGTDVAPKVIIIAGLTSGNPIFNHLFSNSQDGPLINIQKLQEISRDYSSRICTPIFVGIRTGYIQNEDELKKLNDNMLQITTPLSALSKISELL